MVDRQTLRARFECDDHPLVLRDADPIGPRRRLRFETASGEAVRGWLLEPEGAGPHPAIVYIHAHGNDYVIGADEVIAGRPALQGPLGPALVAAGFRVLAIDLPCFGERRGMTESAAAKAALWHGRSLAGQMLGELAAATAWLAADPATDAGRIGAFGLSMGATLGYWLAAVEPRIAAVAHLCCFADFEPLIATGAHDLHGIYLTVPGLLELASNGEIAGMSAPRPQFLGIGDLDPLTPLEAVEPALTTLRTAYAASGAPEALRVHRETGAGHWETPAMRAALIAFLTNALGHAAASSR